MEIKLKERQLLAYFRKNARQTLTKISRQTGIPVSTIFDKLRKYEEEIITKHSSLLDFEKLGYMTRAQVFLRTTPENRKLLASMLSIHQNVNNVFRVNNGYDFAIEVIFRTVQELENFIEDLELERGVTEKQVFYVISEIARETFLCESKF
ncbi:Lrp/AsnC family transcriptional regulator [Candidatus Woesearchaeota archaeon]|nr:Lrp/AsnC family transcriptional regulator [Candidatus Woesearchaeota archaeon]